MTSKKFGQNELLYWLNYADFIALNEQFSEYNLQNEHYALVNDRYIFSYAADQNLHAGQVALNGTQREILQIELNQTISIKHM